MTTDRQQYPCLCGYACKGSWSLQQNQFCKWNNPGRAVEYEMEQKERERVSEGKLEWRLRFAPASLTREDQLVLASIVAAYRELLTCPSRRRNEVVRLLRPQLQHTGEHS